MIKRWRISSQLRLLALAPLLIGAIQWALVVHHDHDLAQLDRAINGSLAIAGYSQDLAQFAGDLAENPNLPRAHAQWTATYERLGSELAQIRSINPQVRSTLGRIRELHQAVGNSFLNLQSSRTRQTTGLNHRNRVKQILRRISFKTNAMLDQSVWLTRQHLEYAEVAHEQTQRFGLMTIAAVAIAVVLFAWIAAKRLANRLRRLDGELKSLVAMGDSRRISDRGNDEIGDVAVEINEMLGRLEETAASRTDLLREVERREQVEAEQRRLLHADAERIKELRCIYAITGLAAEHDEVGALMREVVGVIASGWQYPDATEAAILFDDQQFGELSADIVDQHRRALVVDGVERGCVMVGYTQRFPRVYLDGPFLSEEHALLESIANTLGTTLSRYESQAKLAHLATHDALTGLFNRRAFMQRFDEEIRRARRYGRVVSLLFFDLDLFKKINDELGHKAGDDVLRGVAQTLTDQLRSIDIPGRFGGEEFVALLPETDTGQAQIAAERIRLAVASMRCTRPGLEQVAVTVSIGVAGFPAHGGDTDSLLDHADQAMYVAKTEGRNQVRVASVDDKADPVPSTE